MVLRCRVLAEHSSVLQFATRRAQAAGASGGVGTRVARLVEERDAIHARTLRTKPAVGAVLERARDMFRRPSFRPSE